MWAALLAAFFLLIEALFLILDHIIITKREPVRVSPTTGVVAGGILAVGVIILLICAWRDYRRVRAAQKYR